MGPDAAAEKTVTWPDINSKLFSLRDTYRNDIARRLVSNSPIGMSAIRAKSKLDWDVFGHINTQLAVSGIDGWLFYKPSFLGGECLSDRDIDLAIQRAAAMHEVAKAIDTDYRVSISPDKEVVYPEKLGAAAALAGCKSASASRWRKKTQEADVPIIDHLKMFDHTHSDDLLYFKTDTHWNDLGKAKAMKQLAEAYLRQSMPSPQEPSAAQSKSTDIMRNMLRLENREVYRKYDAFWKSELPSAVKQRISSTVIVHDSFYESAQEGLGTIFEKPVFINYISKTFDRDTQTEILKRPKHILVSSVERMFFHRILSGQLSWRGGVGMALLEANARLAMTCKLADVPNGEISLTRASVDGKQSYKTDQDPQFHIELPKGGKPCLRVSFETSASSPSQIYLPTRDKRSGRNRYAGGFAIDFSVTSATRDLWLLLPDKFAGLTIRLDPINEAGQISDFRVQVGTY